MNRLVKAAVFLSVLGGACHLGAQTADIGKITLSGPNFGYQTVGVYNLTGASSGCEQFAAPYNVCNGLNISTWQLTITFAANVSGIAPSPLVFTSNGTSDQIPPTDSNFDAYTGQAANPWSLSFSLQNAACSPSCDATISSITFSGTLDTTSLNLYNTSAAGPYILDSLPSSAFSVTWNIPATDYTATPGSLFDSTDIPITNQPQLTSQTITFGPLSDLLMTSTTPALSATATSKLDVNFTSNSPLVCTVSDTTMTLVSAGVCSITASQAGDSTYAAAPPVTQTFNVNQATQTITFGPLSDLAITATPPALSATASSTLKVAFTSNTTSVCTVSDTAITLVAGGTCSITASQEGTVVYAPAATVTQTFQVTLAPQTITFGPISNQIFSVGGTLPLTATASSKLAVSYTSNTLAVCTVSSSTVAFVTVGNCSITANQAGDGTTYAAATSLTQTFNIQATQTITFGPISNIALDATAPALSASASSTLGVTFTSTTSTVCTVVGTAVTLATAGTCTIAADQGGDPTHAAAPTVTRSFTVLALQTITFGPIGNIALTATPPALSAAASSGLGVSFASNTQSVCTVSETTVKLLTMGTCSITASQTGDGTRAAAPTVTQMFQVLALQTITFGPISNIALTATPPALSAIASSTLGVTFTSTTSTVCTVVGTAVKLVATGTCTISASQAGDGMTYAPAANVSESFTVFNSLFTDAFATQGNTLDLTKWTTVTGAPSFLGRTQLADWISQGSTGVFAVGSGGAQLTLNTFNPTGSSLYGTQGQTIAWFQPSGNSIVEFSSTLQLTSVQPGIVYGTYLYGCAPALCATQHDEIDIELVTNSLQSSPGQVELNRYAAEPLGAGHGSLVDLPVGFDPLAVHTWTIRWSLSEVDYLVDGTLLLAATDHVPQGPMQADVVAWAPDNTWPQAYIASLTQAASQGQNQAYTALLTSATVNQTQGSPLLQAITFGALSDVSVDAGPIQLSATATSGQPVTFTSTTSGVCLVTDTSVSLSSAGTCTIVASRPGDSNYAAAPSVTQSFTVNPIPQTITFSSIASQPLGSPVNFTATVSSGLGISYVSNSLSVCTVQVSTVSTISLLTTGTCSITASQAGDSTHAAAAPVTQTFTVTLEPQTIAFGPIDTILLTATPPPLSATASSGLKVSFASTTQTVCTVSGTITVNLLTTGTCSITATQAGDTITFAAATPVVEQFLITTLTPQSITFTTIPAQTIGVAPPALSATASSNLGVTFTSNSSSVCTVAQNTTITLVSIGTCSITASQPGNLTVYAAATPMTQTFVVNGTPQTIAFSAIATQTLGTAPPALSAMASSGLKVSFASTTQSVCTVQNSAITLVTAGSCSITATQPGDTIYAAATPAVQSFTVNLTPQTIAFGPIDTILLTATPPALSATASSGLKVSFLSNSNSVCMVQDTTVTLVAQGTCSITASQSGSTTYAAATSVTQMFLVTTLTPQSITFAPLSSQAFGTTAPALNATATSSLAVTFTSNSTSVCTVLNTTISLASIGTCSITASQGGNGTYAAATPIPQMFTVTPGANVIAFAGPGAQTLGQTPPALSATATSGAGVTFTSTTNSVCTVSSTTLALVAAGTCTVTASQGANGNYAAATPVSQSFAVNPAGTGGGGGGGNGGGGNGGGGSSLTVAPTSVTISAIQGGLPGTAQVTLSYPTFTQGAPTFSANFSVNNGQGWLSVSPSSGTMALASTQGLQFTYSVTLTISADPGKLTGSGSPYTGAVNISAAGGIASVPVTVNVSATPATYNATPQSLTFNYQLGSAATPPAQLVSVFSNPIGAGYTVSATSAGGGNNWLTATADSATPITPGAISVSVSTSGFTQAGQFSGQVAIDTGSSTIDVPVTFNIAASQPPATGLAPAQETFSIQQGGSPSNGQVTVLNTGGGTLAFTASATSDNGWLSVNGSGSGSATPSSPATVAFTINPQGLKPGVYSGKISVSGASTTLSTTIVLGITSPLPQIQLSRNGISPSAISNGSVSAPEVVSVSNSGGGTLKWSASASTLSGGKWLTVSPLTGTSQAGAAGSTVSISANPANLTPGTYSGSVNFTAQGAVNSPQTLSVTFTVSAAAHSPGVFVIPGAQILIGNGSIEVFNLGSPVAYSARTSAPWLSVSPSSGTLNSLLTTLRISVDFSKTSGILQTGSVSLGFGDGSGATVTVFGFNLSGGLPGHDVQGPRSMTTVSACPGGKPSFLIPVFQQPSSGASLQASYPADVTVQAIDDCGNPVTAAAGGSVQVTFSNGDPGINLVDTGSGIWEGTWTPVTAASQVTMQIAASENGVTLSSSSGIPSSETVSVTAAGAGAPPQPTGIANAASAGQAIPSVVAPGSYVAIYGTNLAGSGNPNATAGQPLPTSLNGVQVTLGGLPLPLNYASSAQINAVIPQGIAPNATYPLIVVNGTTQSVPVPLTVTELQPATYTFNETGSGAGVVTDALTGTPISASNPAHAGQNLVIYMTGLGALTGANGEQEPSDGAIAPTTTLYRTQSNVSVTIGGVQVPATQFAGLTPTLTALYQVNVQMPNGITPGSAVPVVVTATDSATGITATSNSVTIAVQ